MKVLFCTDLHGSQNCFDLLIRSLKSDIIHTDLVIIGGDLVGKRLILHSPLEDGSSLVRTAAGPETISSAQLNSLRSASLEQGAYLVAVPNSFIHDLQVDDEYEQLLLEARKFRLTTWLEQLEELSTSGIPVVINLGNDDPFELDGLFSDLSIQLAEGQSFVVDEYCEVMSCGYANLTPWGAPRDESEDMLEKRLDALMAHHQGKRIIANFHCPPFGSSLDNATLVDDNGKPIVGFSGPKVGPVGSRAVRNWINQFQPVLGLHGHIHEAKGVSKIGESILINPGSRYREGKCSIWLGELVRGELIESQFYLLESGQKH